MDMYQLKFPYRRMLAPVIQKLRWLHPDMVSYAAVPVAAAIGWCFFDAANRPILLVVAIILALLRMTLNTLDGLLAIQRGNLSGKGEIINALPDRYSDIFIVAGIALSPLCRNWLGIAAICSMLLVSYAGMLGKALGVSWQHHGPMGKVERLVVMMVFALVQFLILPERQTFTFIGITATPMEWSMGFIVILGQCTVLRRVYGQLREIRFKEAQEHILPQQNADRAIVLYDSNSGNTRQIAEQIASGIGCLAQKVSEVKEISKYQMVVLGTPNIRKHPTPAIQKFLKETIFRPSMLAVFVTYGMPIWGTLTSRTCLHSLSTAWNLKPIAQFACPGYHKKYKTYKKRPNNIDLTNAFLFGFKLRKKLNEGKKN